MMESRSFGRLLVVEMGGSAAGAYCSKLFGDYGAEVHLIGSSPPGPGAAAFYHRSAHRARSDRAPGGDDGAMSLLDMADVVIQSSASAPISEPVNPRHGGQIVVRISPFADYGPYAEWRSTDLVDSAISGHLRLSGDPDREPLQPVPDLVHHAAGVAAFIAATAALVTRVRTGAGQIVETSHQEVLVALHQFTLCRFTHNGAVLNRLGNRYAGPGSPIGAYECADGWIGLALPQDDQVERMAEVTGLIAMLERPDVDSVWDLMTKPGLLDGELVPYLKTQKRDDVVELFQALRLPCAPVSDLDDVLADPHLEARRFWYTTGPDGSAGSYGSTALRLPGGPFRMSDHGWSPEPKRRGDDHRPLPAGSESPADLGDGPLTGLRVIDMTRVWAGPLATRILADLGAEVLMTEVPWTRTPREVAQSYIEGTHFFPDDVGGDRPWNRSAFHNKYANNKLSTVIELNTEPGRELFAALLPSADILVENYSPRVMPGFGFDADRLRELNDDLIYITMPGYGRDGPHADWVAYGPTIDGHVGHTALTGYRGEGPWKCGVAWPDPISGLHGAAAALVAVLDRLIEPERGGQTVEVAQIEAAVNMIGQHVVAQQLVSEQAGGRQAATDQTDRPRRWGNRRPGRSPQGVYRCRGDDRWIAISVLDDRSWWALCRLLDIGDLQHLNADERWRAHDELDRRIGAATAGWDDRELMERLQGAGVAAGAVLAAPDVQGDPQLAALGFFVELAHPEAGTHPWARFPGRLSLTPATLRRPAALMGEHNHYAACRLAGYDEDRYRSLLDSGVLRTEPPV